MAAISSLEASPTGLARTGFDVAEAMLLSGATLLMLWPALYNGFPLIFSDTGTYISQAMEFHLGWDRPPFYSFLILALDWGRSLWPPVIAQCALAAWLIRRTQRMIAPHAGIRAGAMLLLPLALLTSLPWTAAQIMPDIFTPLMVLAFADLALSPQPARREMMGLMAVIAVALMVHLSNPPIYAGLCLSLLILRIGARRRIDWTAVLLPLAVGMAGLVGVNVIAAGTVSPSPYGATFMLARLVSDGPARVTLARDCPVRHWALCRYRPELAVTADQFLWRADSPLYRAGGPIRLIDQTNAIVDATVAREPGIVLRNALRDALRQSITFAPGSGLRPWYATAWQTIKRNFPAPEVAAFTAGRQAHGRLAVGAPLLAIVQSLTIAGIVLTVGFVLVTLVHALRVRARWREPLLDDRLFGLACLVLLALLGNAIVTGALSGPHDRYQSRIVWLAVLTGGLVLARGYDTWRSRPISNTA